MDDPTVPELRCLACLHVEPGDVLLAEFNEDADMRQADDLIDKLRERWPDTPIWVVPGRLRVIKPRS